ncbi:MAG: electron transfer flavoprotein subunit alpha/FixB family protein [Deltaproteobacteria bacterium]|jgi:electron transfer flavoprotein alpha subunit|nr:electron transfer flavoprotein subunit alpha/FixB family protein [Deltaproteobacteria bacterium]
MRDIWIIAENLPWAGTLAAGAASIGKGAKIVAFVNGDEAEAKAVIAQGAAEAFYLPLPAAAPWEGYAPALAEKAKADKPALILLSTSRRCRDVAAQLAAVLDAPCFSEGKNIVLTESGASVETMLYGGLAVKSSSVSAETVLVTVGAKDFEPLPADASRSGPVGTLPLAAGPVAVVGRKPRAAQTVDLAAAVKVVGVGRGVAEEGDLAIVRDLAEALGAEVGCSRPIAEFFKWMPEECYIGISGQQIKPQLYVAVGISGQAQHYFGIRDAKTIVSINKDKESLMNQNADYFIAADWKAVVPELIKAVRGA